VLDFSLAGEEKIDAEQGEQRRGEQDPEEHGAPA
jgi:hypothetical protein